MSDTSTAVAAGPAPKGPTVGDRLRTLESTGKTFQDGLDELRSTVKTFTDELRKPVYPIDAAGNAIHPSRLFAAVNGPLAKDSEPYSVMKAMGYAQRWTSAENCKFERSIHDRLCRWLSKHGYAPSHPQATVVPFSTAHLPPPENDEEEKLLQEIRVSIKGYQGRYDPDEASYVIRKTGVGGEIAKALGTFPDTSGGVLVGFPTLGELIDLQRNLEVFPRAGAREVMLPPNGRIQYPKLASGATAFWVGEGTAITESQQQFGYLNLEPHKLCVLVKLNNELLRYTSPTTEALVRSDMAQQAALAADLAMLQGTGGMQIKGLVTYASAATWSQGTDLLLAYTVTGNLFQPNDPADMEALLPDTAGEPTAWIMRRQLWAKIRNRRADAITASDAKGPFVFNLMRDVARGFPLELEGVPVVRSSQVSATRGGGTQTYVILGNFREWLIGRLGVLEFLMTGTGDSAFVNDQTWLRAIQTMDAGARHAASFVFADAINVA